MLPRPISHLLLGLTVLALDALTSPYLTFPILFIVPVSLGAWFRGARWGAALSLILSTGRTCLAAFYERPYPWPYIAANAVIRLTVFLFIVVLIDRLARQNRQLQHEVRLLQGFLPICMYCKRIRDEQQTWQDLEPYITKRSEAKFSHTMCPTCAQEHFPEIFPIAPGP